MKHGLINVLLMLLAVPLSFGQSDSFFGSEGESESGPSALELGGKIELETSYFPDYDRLEDSAIIAVPGLELSLAFNGPNSQVNARLKYRQSDPYQNPEDLIEEAYLRLYWERFYLEAGYLKLIWGKGDKMHVIDTLNPLDYSEFILPDYLDQKRAEKMIRLSFDLGTESQWSLIYLPVFTPNNIPRQGRWAPDIYRELADNIEAYKTMLTTAGKSLYEAEQLAAEVLQEADTGTLDYGQYGTRFTTTLGRFDLGASYLYTFIREPSIDTSGMSDPTPRIKIEYDRVHQFGLEGSAAVGPYTLRSELGYFMTQDFPGDDARVHNHEIGYLYGVDWDLPVSNLMLAVQGIGRYLLQKGKIESGDVQYNKDDIYTQNILTFRVADSYSHETIKPELFFLWDIEREGFLLKPNLELTLRDDARLSLSYFLFWGDDKSYFGQFDDNDLLRIGFAYSF